MQLSPLQQDFVLHFGEMGSRWGINRTVGQIYALLFLAAEPLHAEQIVERLGFARSNVSTGLKELQAWNLVRLVHVPGDRRDHFTTPRDLWEIVRILAEERKKREIDPTLSKLRALQLDAATDPADAHARARIEETVRVIELFAGWYDDVKHLDTDRLAQLLALGAKVQQVLEMKDRLTVLAGGRRRAKPHSAEEA